MAASAGHRCTHCPTRKPFVSPNALHEHLVAKHPPKLEKPPIRAHAQSKIQGSAGPNKSQKSADRPLKPADPMPNPAGRTAKIVGQSKKPASQAQKPQTLLNTSESKQGHANESFKSHRCLSCARGFVKADGLRAHATRMHPEIFLPAEDAAPAVTVSLTAHANTCNASYNTSADEAKRKTHALLPPKPHGCSWCNRGFAEVQDLELHVAAKHVENNLAKMGALEEAEVSSADEDIGGVRLCSLETFQGLGWDDTFEDGNLLASDDDEDV